MRPFRVVTLNLWGDREPLGARLDAAAAGLASLAPDVVLLQEVRVGLGSSTHGVGPAPQPDNTAAALTARLGSRWSFVYACATAGAAGTWGPNSPAGEEGLAILARHPIAESRHVELPEAREKERRILLSAYVEPEGAPDLWVHTTHLHWRLTDGVAREKQVVAIDDAVRAIQTDSPQIIGGDFNAAPDCDEIRFMTGRHTLGGRRTYWVDSWVRARAGDGAAAAAAGTGITWASRNPMTDWLRWLERDRRIDYIFVSNEKPDGRGRVLDSRVVLDAPGANGAWPSDHFAVMTEVAL